MFTEEKTVITPDELKEAMPLSDKVAEVKQKNEYRTEGVHGGKG